ncbi:hypothetical protein LSH36_513g02001 [Paralvinella palmiformis]|uniref:Uncharacterized protein n=1 Tax=Paralvinella palmiformis TaxID=53620 RepID=A0AAD9J8L7_9ANNE|nr:hypothetical protein LSH36_513g02001 [Paralvinella palmiformis]
MNHILYQEPENDPLNVNSTIYGFLDLFNASLGHDRWCTDSGLARQRNLYVLANQDRLHDHHLVFARMEGKRNQLILFVDADKNIHRDEKRRLPFTDVMYQKVDELLYHLDVACTQEVIIVKDGEGSESFPDATTSINSSVTSQKDIYTEENPSESSSEAPQSLRDVELEDRKSTIPHRSFSTEETLYLVDVMREYVVPDDKGLPKSLAELESRIRLGRGQKKISVADSGRQTITNVLI